MFFRTAVIFILLFSFSLGAKGYMDFPITFKYVGENAKESGKKLFSIRTLFSKECLKSNDKFFFKVLSIRWRGNRIMVHLRGYGKKNGRILSIADFIFGFEPNFRKGLNYLVYMKIKNLLNGMVTESGSLYGNRYGGSYAQMREVGEIIGAFLNISEMLFKEKCRFVELKSIK